MTGFVRAISQLENLAAAPHVSARIEVSQYVAGNAQYVSRNCGYGQLTSWMNDSISASMTGQYNLSCRADGVEIGNIVQKVRDLYKGDVTVSGKKTFTGGLKTSNGQYTALAANDVPNKGQVQALIQDAGSYIGSSDVSPEPFQQDNGETSWFAKTEQAGEAGYVRLRFGDEGVEDKFRTTNEGTADGTGQLVMWGWLADNGNVLAELAWVRLEAEVNIGGVAKWVPVQVQPWIQGAKSRVLQYVGFSVPVHAGLKLRVKTGFDVNVANGAFSTVGSMTYESAADGRCGFFGYIIHKV